MIKVIASLFFLSLMAADLCVYKYLSDVRISREEKIVDYYGMIIVNSEKKAENITQEDKHGYNTHFTETYYHEIAIYNNSGLVFKQKTPSKIENEVSAAFQIRSGFDITKQSDEIIMIDRCDEPPIKTFDFAHYFRSPTVKYTNCECFSGDDKLRILQIRNHYNVYFTYVYIYDEKNTLGQFEDCYTGKNSLCVKGKRDKYKALSVRNAIKYIASLIGKDLTFEKVRALRAII